MKAILVALVMSSALALTACQGSGAQPVSVDPSPSTPEEGAPAEGDQELVVSANAFQPRYVFKGKTAASDSVVLAVPPGMVFETRLRDGDRVNAGQSIGRLNIVPRIRAELVSSAAMGTAGASRLADLSAREGDITAAVSGQLVLSGSGPRISSAGLDVTAVLNPLQELRLQGVPFAASLDVEDLFGFRSADCTAWWVQLTDAGPELHCRIPPDVQTAAGLPATTTMLAKAQELIAVPARYIGFDKTNGGNYYVVRRDAQGASGRVAVVVGATDGVRRVIVSGVAAGDRLLPVDNGR